MADFDSCINQAFKAGKITKDVKDRLISAEDKNAAINELTNNLSRQKRETAIQATRLSEAVGNMSKHSDGEYDGLMALMTKDPKGKAGYYNVDYLAKYYQGKYHSRFNEALSRFRTRRLGFSQDEEGLEKLVRAVYGETVDDAEIMNFAKTWKDLTEEVRKDFNMRGGSISKNERWLLPQNHDMRAVQKVGKDEWKRRIVDKLDRQNMTDDLGNVLDDKQFDESLDFVYETITTGGLNKARDFTVPRLGKKLSRKGSDRRFLFFKDAESWLEYQKDFGKGDIFTTLTDWVDTKAHDTALLEIFGTNPNMMFDALQAHVAKTKGLSNRQKSFSRAVFNVVSGKTSEGELVGLADFMQTTRNIITASTLGKAFLSAFSDIGFQAITTRYNNIPTFKTLNRQLSLFAEQGDAGKKAAVKMGLIAEAWLGRAHGANRYADIFGTGPSAKLAEGVMRGSLLSPWTDAGRKAFGMEFSAVLADNFSKSLDQLDDSFKRAFKTYGINAEDWDQFRASKNLKHKGAQFADFTQDGGKKFHNMVMSEMDFAVPTPDARVRAITTGGLGRATVAGQGWRSAMMLKSFPITIATSHFYRAAYQSTISDKIAYTAFLAATTTVLGGVALQAKDVSAGREPRPVDGKFFAAAFQQGGGLGIFGDFLFSDVNRFGGGLSQTIFGPTGELLDTGVKFTLGNIREAITGEETNVLGEGVDILKRYTPDVWQTQLFTDAIFDQIKLLADPKAQKRFNKIVKKRAKEYDQGYWWSPGEILPEALQ